jgi:hypothetical protein
MAGGELCGQHTSGSMAALQGVWRRGTHACWGSRRAGSNRTPRAHDHAQHTHASAPAIAAHINANAGRACGRGSRRGGSWGCKRATR